MEHLRWVSRGGIIINTPPPQLPPTPPPFAGHLSQVKPSVGVVVGVLTTIFSITFLLLLYAKHCKRATTGYGGSPPNMMTSSMRKNSGVTRAVVESLPVFRFGSLRGPKDGLECAVCLSRFEPLEVLRLLPKCKHAFHVECVDTWLDAHSTCPLCRYRVDQEDILLLLEHSTSLPENQPLPDENRREPGYTRRVSGRHSSAGERGTTGNSNKHLQILLPSQTPSLSSRRSLDSRTKPVAPPKKSGPVVAAEAGADEQVSIGCFDRTRKDGLLLASSIEEDRRSFEKRFEHRIVISDETRSLEPPNRWSDLHPSDLMYLRSEMIMNDSRRFSTARGSPYVAEEKSQQGSNGTIVVDGRIVNNPRSVSEIIGVSRRALNYENGRERRHRHVAGVVSRWLALVSASNHRQPAEPPLPL